MGRDVRHRRGTGRDRGPGGAPAAYCPASHFRAGNAPAAGSAAPRGRGHHDRPELLPACVALVAHPDDERTRRCSGDRRTPLFGVRVPILAHRLADPAKGTGIVMVCTFGDMTDVTWWRDLQLETRPVIGQDGRLLAAAAPPGMTSAAGAGRLRAARRPAGQGGPPADHRPAARRRRSARRARADPARGEVLRVRPGCRWRSSPPGSGTSANGSPIRCCASTLLARGRELGWHPEHMRARYEHWVNGLTGDWLVSRQRYNGVPIPVWYPLDADGELRPGASRSCRAEA